MERDEEAELLRLIGGERDGEVLCERLEAYYDEDIAEALAQTDVARRWEVYRALGPAWTAEIFSYYENVGAYVRELPPEYAAELLIHILETDEEVEEDYAMFGGLTEEEEREEPVRLSVRKRFPWLIVLLFLGLIVSGVVGMFEGVIASFPVIVFFQTMILGMAGNAGTQSLAVTIRTLADEEDAEDGQWRRRRLWKELRVGLLNGVLIGTVSFAVVAVYLVLTRQEIVAGNGFLMADVLPVAGVIGVSMLLSITLAGFIGTALPMLLSRLHIDPAVASGPFITTLNDIAAVVIYYGLTLILFRTVIGI